MSEAPAALPSQQTPSLAPYPSRPMGHARVSRSRPLPQPAPPPPPSPHGAAEPERVGLELQLQVAVVGSGGCGKTSLLRRFTEDAFDDCVAPTADVDWKSRAVTFGSSRITLRLWDTPSHDERDLLRHVCGSLHGLVVAFDLTSAESYAQAKTRFAELLREQADIPCCALVGCKSDLLGAIQRGVAAATASEFAACSMYGGLYTEASAKTSANVESLFMSLAHNIMKRNRKDLVHSPRSPSGKLINLTESRRDDAARPESPSAAASCACSQPPAGPASCHRPLLANSIDRVYIGTEAVKALVQYCTEAGITRAVVLADINTYVSLGSEAESALADTGIETNSVVLGAATPKAPVVADEATVMQVLLSADARARQDSPVPVFVVVGSGTLTDIGRFLSHRLRTQFICVPTAPSTDSYSYSAASLLIGGVKQSVPCHVPRAVFSHLPALCAAPKELVCAGFGELLSKATALADWVLGSVLWIEPEDRDVFLKCRETVRRCLHPQVRAEIMARSPSGMRSLMEGLLEVGASIAIAGHSAPGSGSEHHIAQYWELQLLQRHLKTPLHGTSVAVSSIIVAGLWSTIRKITQEEALERLQSCAWSVRQAEDEIRQAFGPVSQSIISSQSPFLTRIEREHESIKESIVEHWKEITDIAATVPSVEELSALLSVAGVPTDPSQIDVPEDIVSSTLWASHYMRGRFTVLKLASFLGLFMRHQ
eukprot:m51a1_g60 hypothetical protein (713) ;mRNA; f:200047-202512